MAIYRMRFTTVVCIANNQKRYHQFLSDSLRPSCGSTVLFDHTCCCEGNTAIALQIWESSNTIDQIDVAGIGPMCCSHSLFLASGNLLLSQIGSGLSQLCLGDSPQLGCQLSILCFCSWLGNFAVLQVSARLALELWCCGCIHCCCCPLHTTWNCQHPHLSTDEANGQCPFQCPWQQVRVMVRGLQRNTAVAALYTSLQLFNLLIIVSGWLSRVCKDTLLSHSNWQCHCPCIPAKGVHQPRVCKETLLLLLLSSTQQLKIVSVLEKWSGFAKVHGVDVWGVWVQCLQRLQRRCSAWRSESRFGG